MPSKHAEMDAYHKIRHYKNIPKKVDFFVIKLCADGSFSESRPCRDCLLMMHRSGLNIRYVYYSTHDGIVREKFSTMLDDPRTYVSRGRRIQNK